MTPATYDLLCAIARVDGDAVRSALAAGADVNAADQFGRSLVSYAALGNAIHALDTTVQPRLSERSLDILHIITQQPELSLYSLNAPMPWVGGVTLLGLMSWLNMPSEIMCLLDFTAGLLEVNAMDEKGATPLMYAARDGNLQVVQRLLAHGARPDLRDVSHRSAIQHAHAHAQSLWLCEESLRRSRQSKSVASLGSLSSNRASVRHSPRLKTTSLSAELFYSPPHPRLLHPPPMTRLEDADLRRTFEILLRAIRTEDIYTLRSMLVSPLPGSDLHVPPMFPASLPAPFLANFRDSAGLTLVHHAVSRRYPSVAVIDALYYGGCDVGLFSTLGFTPLHHLARTARDDTRGAKNEQEASRPSPTCHPHPLYSFTMHIIRDLHAPLGATDSRGETPLHAAAEHGRSFSVLQAMLDCDSRFSGKGAVREARNERGLRPLDVARPEFLSLFADVHHSHMRVRFNLQLSPHPAVRNPHHVREWAYDSPSSVGSNGLVKKESSASFASGSSDSSSPSCGTHSTHRSHRSCLMHKLPPPIHVVATPNPASPLAETYLPVDVFTSALDVLHFLSSSASALNAVAHSHVDTEGAALSPLPLPDLSELSNMLLFTQNLASHVLEHWAERLESVRAEFGWATRELWKVEELMERVASDVGSCVVSRRRYRAGGPAGAVGTSSFWEATRDGLLKDACVQTDVPQASGGSHPPGSPVPPAVEPASSALESGACGDVPARAHTRLEHGAAEDVAEKAEDEDEDEDEVEDARCPDAVGRQVKAPPPLCSLETGSPGLAPPPVDWLRQAPKVLQRADRDIREVIGHFVGIQQSFLRAQHSIEQARTLVQESIKSREDLLHALIRYRQELLTESFHLSPTLVHLPDTKPNAAATEALKSRAAAAMEQKPTGSTTTPVLNLIGEPHVLRRLLLRKLAKHVEHVFCNVQKAHVWLRIIREVLRGLKRRALVDH